MTYEQFWEQDCCLVRAYREAAKIRRDLQNQQAWLQGMYIYEAIADVAPILMPNAKKGTRPKPYRSEPYPLDTPAKGQSKMTKEQKSDAKAKAMMEMFATSFNAKFKEKKEGETVGG